MTLLREWGPKSIAGLAALLFLALLASLTRLSPIPPFAYVAVATIIGLSVYQPRAGLLVVAALTPFVAWIGRHWNGSIAWPEVVVVAFAAGFCVRRTVGPRPQRDGLDAPWLVAVALVLGSLAVHFLIESWRFGSAGTIADITKLVRLDYFMSSTSGDPIDAAMRLIESLVIFRAAATAVRDSPGFAPRLVSWAVCGAAAAAGLNLLRIYEGAIRFESWPGAFVRLLLSERANVHYGDLNAAGSYFVMMLLTAIGLALRPKGWPWFVTVLVIAASVWISGSRTAVLAGMLALALPAAVRVWRIRRGGIRVTTLGAAALLIALLAAVAAFAIPERGNQKSALTAAQVRVELAWTSARMTASSPVFGIGIGRYYSRSGEFSSQELLTNFPPAIHENAHNNFLQILAELGMLGLASALWLLVTAASYGRRLLAADERDPVRWSLATGLVAFVVSWLGGHPLLIDEPAFAFWLLLGTLAGWGASFDVASSPKRLRDWVVVAAILGIAVSVPIRADRQKADFNLEHRGVGLSTWRDAVDGVRYRLAGSASSVFVPAHVPTVTIPMRSTGERDLRVELRLDGRPADVLTVPADRWHFLRFSLPQNREGPRFHRLDFAVVSPTTTSDGVLMIGKVEPK